MDWTVTGIKTWVKDNPVKAAGIAIAATAGIALIVSPKARKFVGLGGVKTKQIHYRTKKSRKVKALLLR
jgi:predicted flavoprotein YhiN